MHRDDLIYRRRPSRRIIFDRRFLSAFVTSKNRLMHLTQFGHRTTAEADDIGQPFLKPHQFLFRRESRCGYAGHDFRILSSRRAARHDLNDTGGKPYQCANLPGGVIRAGKVEDQSAAPGPN